MATLLKRTFLKVSSHTWESEDNIALCGEAFEEFLRRNWIFHGEELPDEVTVSIHDKRGTNRVGVFFEGIFGGTAVDFRINKKSIGGSVNLDKLLRQFIGRKLWFQVEY